MLSFEELELIMDEKKDTPHNGVSEPQQSSFSDYIDDDYQGIQDMDMKLGNGGRLPDSFEVGVRPQYDLENF